MDDLARFESGLRRRRHVAVGVLIALGAVAAVVFVYSAHRAGKAAAQPDVQVIDVADLSEAERADIEKQTGLRLRRAAPPCGAGMIGIPARGGVAAFCLDAFDVTVGEFLACVDAGACPEFPRGPLCPDLRTLAPEEPVPCIEHEPSDAYCRWRGRRYTVGDELLSTYDTVGEMQLRCASSSI